MSITPASLFAGGNRHTAAADWVSTTLAFGSGSNIALWNPQDPATHGLHALLRGHTDTVNAVRFCRGLDGQLHLLSGSADCTVRIWQPSRTTYTELAVLSEHAASINTLAVLGDDGVFATGSADGTIKVWRLSKDGASLLQSITLKPRFLPLDIGLSRLGHDQIVMAVAGTTPSLQIYIGAEGQLALGATLTGHEGWVRSLDFVHESAEGDGDVLLASASQDKYIRLWRFHRGTELPALKKHDDELGAASTLSNKAYYLGHGADRHSITFEALLIGHEDWIYTARWHTGPSGPRLLTASADASLSIWARDAESELWESTVRLGEISATKGATSATGSTGGFWNGLWAPDGNEVVSLGRTGAWRKWALDNTGIWKQAVGVSGHVKDVKAIAWSGDGAYLLSTGSDQTTRLWAPWQRVDQTSWHEMTRPQIHGYDLNCIDTLGARQFVSGADEKLLRVFNQPKAVAKLLAAVSGIVDTEADDLPDAANVPVLGLSNKAVTEAADGEEETTDSPDAQQAKVPAIETDHPPYEDQLARHTLWPEHEKLYGHGYEISAVASSHDGSVVATACRASSLDHAVIRLYETRDWREIKPSLEAHGLTITRLAFSPDDNFLLSVGRDRQLAVFRRGQTDRHAYSRLQAEPKAHSRMILDCAWAPTAAGYYFATAGRDKSVKIWQLQHERQGFQCMASIPQLAAVTAVAFEPVINAGTVRLAVGLEDGQIGIWSCNVATGQAESSIDVEGSLQPSGVINKLAWRPIRDGPPRPLLAACSDDCSVRIYDIPGV